jgi:pSer/pThr/pTyr-binding forkhead associated (FHA) protein
MEKALLTFAFYRAGRLERRARVAADIVKIGSDPKSHLIVDDERASRMHAVIEVNGPRDITLIDLGNEPTTLVNGAKINKCKLAVGDRIRIGDSELELCDAEPSTALASNPRFDTLPRPFFSTANAVAPDSRLENPFMASALPNESFAGLTKDDVTFTLLKSGPDVNPEEVELSNVTAIEVMVLWGSNVLHVAHLTPARDFSVGEADSKAARSDFFIPSERLGKLEQRLVVVEGDSAWVVLPANAEGFLEIGGKARLSLADARARSEARLEPSGGHRYPLENAARARIELGGFVFQVASVRAGKPLQKGPLAGWDWNLSAYFGLSFLSHASIVAALAFFMPPLNLTADESSDRDRLYLLQQYLDTAAERERDKKVEDSATNEAHQEGGTGQQASGESGAMGKPTVREVNKRYSVAGPQDNPDPHLARSAALRDAASFGVIALLTGDPNTPTAVFGRDEALGTAQLSANGNMWADDIGDASGLGGLGVSGTGEGAGGLGEGVGQGTIGTIGNGAGTGTGIGFGNGPGGFASSGARLNHGHVTKTPGVRLSNPTVSGRLPPEVIQRIVRQNFGRFRACYQNGLSRNPNLEGRVAARFVIGRDGAVANVSNGGSDLPDSGVVGCVLSAFYGLSFPQPENGIVAVTYPIMLSPG